jgi:hypothetical protein
MYANVRSSGDHTISVIAYLDTGASLSGTGNGNATARATLGLGSVAVNTVRMVKGDIVVSETAEIE